MKTLQDYVVDDRLYVSDAGPEAVVGDQVKLFLDQQANPSFPEFIYGIIQHPIVRVNCDSSTSYDIEYNEADLLGAASLIRPGDVIDSLVVDGSSLLASQTVQTVPQTFTDPEKAQARVNIGVNAENMLALLDDFYPESFGAIGDGTEDDTVALQNAINAAINAKGRVILGPKTYRITGTLVISGALTVECSGAFPLYGDRSIYGSDIYPNQSPYLEGSVILMTTASTDIIRISVIGKPVNLGNLGLRFADGIKFVNTGHGIVADPGAYTHLAGSFYEGMPNWNAPHKNNGMMESLWENVCVYGTDGNHYAFKLINAQLNQYNKCSAWGGGGWHLIVDTPTGWYGNSTWVQPYICLFVAGTSHAYFLDQTWAGHGVIYTTWVRPQTFAFARAGEAAPLSTQSLFYMGESTRFITVVAPNLESTTPVEGAHYPSYPSPGSEFGPGEAQGMTDKAIVANLRLVNPNNAGSTLLGFWTDAHATLLAALQYNGPNFATADTADSLQYTLLVGNKHDFNCAGTRRLRITTTGLIVTGGITATTTISTTGDISSSGNISSGGNIIATGAMLHSGSLTPSFRVSRRIPQPIANNTAERIIYEEEQWDVTGAFAGSAFTPQVAGRYVFHAGVAVESMPDGGRVQLALYKNGALYGVLNDCTVGAASTPSVCGSCMANANGTTDYFEVFVYQNSGASRSIVAYGGDALIWWDGTLSN